MQNSYIVFYESRHEGWICWTLTLREAKKLLKIENETYYIFKLNININNKTFSPIILQFPFCEYYSCLEINTYQMETINEINKNTALTKYTKLYNLVYFC